MAFNFLYPLLLLLLIPLTAFVLFFGSKSLGRTARWKRNLILTVRVMIMVILVLALAGFSLRFYTRETSTIFVVDSSDSVQKLASQAENFVKDAIAHKKSHDRVGIVNFGSDAGVEMLPSREPVFYKMQTLVNGGFTNIEGALRFAASLIPGGNKKRIVLVTDGQENMGNAMKEIRFLKEQGARVDIYPLIPETGPEVYVSSVDIPQSIRVNEYYDIQVKVSSNVRTGANLKLYQGSSVVSTQRIELQPGENSFVFREQAQKGGTVVYRAELDADADTILKNNDMSAFTRVDDIPRVLIIQGENEGGREIQKVLGDDIQVKTVNAKSAPTVVEGLSEYDSFILSDVGIDDLHDDFLQSLEVAVKHMGKGLIVTGGENSYALGGYKDTALEKLLPVNMDIKSKEEIPNLGLVIIIDKSGSMSQGLYGVSKLELAKEAAIRSTNVLNSKDEIGIIAFDTDVQWVVKTQRLDDLKKVQDDIASIRPGGGTSILPSLDEGIRSVKNASTKLKHVILLTDGQAEKTGYDILLEEAKQEGITISTVAVGADSDTALLEYLAKSGGGRYYYTDEFSDLPKVFTKETYLAAKTYVNNRTFYPQLGSYMDILKGIQSVPTLDGYIGTTPKGTARVVLSSDREDPVLAVWQYGSGRTVAWTSDASGRWTEDWLSWEKSPAFWKNILSWTLQRNDTGDVIVQGKAAGQKGEIGISLENPEAYSKSSIKVTIVDPEHREQEIEMQPQAPGQYSAEFESAGTGVYVMKIDIMNGEELQKTVHTALSISYSPEYLPEKNKGMNLAKAAQEGGGRLLGDAREVFDNPLPPVWNDVELTPLLLTLFILLFVFDIALRRLNFSLKQFEWLMSKAEEGTAVVTSSVQSVIRAAASVLPKQAPGSDRDSVKKSGGQETGASMQQWAEQEMEARENTVSPSTGRKPAELGAVRQGITQQRAAQQDTGAGTAKRTLDTSKLLESKKKRERK